jgi:hypothetical protein
VDPSPTQKYKPNIGGVGVVPKTRDGSAPLPRLRNQTHGYSLSNLGSGEPLEIAGSPDIATGPQLYELREAAPSRAKLLVTTTESEGRPWLPPNDAKSFG